MSNVVQKRGLSKVSLIFACGTALFSDGYANNIIGPVKTILSRIYGNDAINARSYSTTITSLGFAGTVIGMLSFGYLSDRLGRKFGMMGATAIVFVFSGLASASSGINHNLHGMLAMLSACRFLLGIGVGAEYPCGSVAASEQTEEEGVAKNAQNRCFILATNCMICSGFAVSAFIPLVLFWIFGEDHLRAVWRLSLGFGMVPAGIVFLWRLRMEEPTRYRKDCMRRIRVPYVLILKRYWRSLAAISIVWFIWDFIIYPFNIYSSTVINNLTGNTKSLSVIFGWTIVINLLNIPGAVGGAFIVDYLGAKYTLVLSLVLQAIVGFIMSGLYVVLTEHMAAFVVIYGVFLSLGAVGPGNCTLLLAAKAGPTGIRGQYFGVAAAIGKLGAFVGTWVFPPLIEAFGGADTTRGNTGPFWVGSGLSIVSALVTLFFIRPLSSDGMAKEDKAFREYLESHGFDTSLMGDGSDTFTVASSIEVDDLGSVEKDMKHSE